jgi:hypothetical protein
MPRLDALKFALAGAIYAAGCVAVATYARCLAFPDLNHCCEGSTVMIALPTTQGAKRQAKNW